MLKNELKNLFVLFSELVLLDCLSAIVPGRSFLLLPDLEEALLAQPGEHSVPTAELQAA